MLTLRSYQSRIIEAAQQSLRTNRHTGIYAVQGSGKSILAAFMAESASLKGMNVLLLSHRIEILKQNFSKMESLSLSVQILHAGKKLPPAVGIVAAMSQTIAARLRNEKTAIIYREWLSRFDFIIVDEAHIATHDIMFQHFNSKAWVVGMTGTWLRYGGQEQLSRFYSNIVSPVLPSEVVQMGFILPSENYTMSAPRLDDVSVDYATGDYNRKELQSRFAKPDRYVGVIENYKRIIPGKKTLTFTTGSKHCIELTRAFCDAGVRTKYLLSVATDKDDFTNYSGKRQEVVDMLRHGEIDMIVSLDMISTGLDLPELEAVILDYSTKAYTKYAQSVGRGCRPYSGQDKFYVLDFGNNIERFGRFEADPIISLFHKTGEGGVPPTKMCPTDRKDPEGRCGCGRLVAVSIMKCPFCGFEWQTEKQEYFAELQLMVDGVDESNMSIKEWAANKKLEGWSVTRILAAVMAKNKTNMRKAFNEAIPALRTEKGEMISPSYYYFMKKYIIDKGKR